LSSPSFPYTTLFRSIYCRPSCRARTPKRENVRFFETWSEAEKSGLRACMRCKPREDEHRDPLVAKVLKACELLASDEPFDLDSLDRKSTRLNSSHVK